LVPDALFATEGKGITVTGKEEGKGKEKRSSGVLDLHGNKNSALRKEVKRKRITVQEIASLKEKGKGRKRKGGFIVYRVNIKFASVWEREKRKMNPAKYAK